MEDKSYLVKRYIEQLDPIVDFTTIKPGTKMFNRCSLSPDYIDTFVSYDKERDVVTYLNYEGEEWLGRGADYWYFPPELELEQEKEYGGD